MKFERLCLLVVCSCCYYRQAMFGHHHAIYWTPKSVSDCDMWRPSRAKLPLDTIIDDIVRPYYIIYDTIYRVACWLVYGSVSYMLPMYLLSLSSRISLQLALWYFHAGTTTPREVNSNVLIHSILVSKHLQRSSIVARIIDDDSQGRTVSSMHLAYCKRWHVKPWQRGY